jgi:hypothetical protein
MSVNLMFYTQYIANLLINGNYIFTIFMHMNITK